MNSNQVERHLIDLGYEFVGWLNNDSGVENKRWLNCAKNAHPKHEIYVKNNENLLVCRECRIYCKLDSSD